MKPMNVWIVEDDPGYRRNLRMSLELEGSVEVGMVFPSCVELFEALEVDGKPDAILMDLGLPGMSGADAIRKLSLIAPEIAVLVLTVFQEKDRVTEALDAGAVGYLLKESDTEEILACLNEVYEDQAVGVS